MVHGVAALVTSATGDEGASQRLSTCAGFTRHRSLRNKVQPTEISVLTTGAHRLGASEFDCRHRECEARDAT